MLWTIILVGLLSWESHCISFNEPLDLSAPGVWVLYCQFAVDKMDKFEEGIEFPREVFERAIKSCGLHVTKVMCHMTCT